MSREGQRREVDSPLRVNMDDARAIFERLNLLGYSIVKAESAA